MRAFEFVTEAEDGTIKIPKKYIKSLKNKVRVIILVQEEESVEKKEKKKRFSAFKVKTKGMHLDREEAHKR
jgi:hypothetical protein